MIEPPGTERYAVGGVRGWSREAPAYSITTMGKTDLLGRMGGEEFAIFHTSAHKEETLAWADDLREQVAKTVISIEDSPVSCTISLGICFSKTENFDAIYRCADRELYRAKDAGRNCIRHSSLG